MTALELAEAIFSMPVEMRLREIRVGEWLPVVAVRAVRHEEYAGDGRTQPVTLVSIQVIGN
jgi:hypothetical protein